MTFSPDLLLHKLDEHRHDAGRYWVAYSGGLDSTVLLHALVARRQVLPAPLAAVHVNHNLHPESASWAAHCRDVCAALGVPFEHFDVTLADGAGISVEAAARDARYDVFRELLVADEILLTAQHQDDQFETFLLQALRGAGPHGLAAMPHRARLGHGWLVRPLLDFTRDELESWARENDLVWLNDPSNGDERFDRNYLRRHLVPLLKQRWPAAAQTLTRSARHCAETAELIDELAARDLTECGLAENVLSVSRLRQLDVSRQRNALRHWLAWQGFPRPAEKKLEHILKDVLEASPDAAPCVHWAQVAVRRYRDGVYAEPARGPMTGGIWQGDTFELGAGCGRLRRVAAGEGLPDGVVEVRYRAGGENLRLAGRVHHHALKKLFQEAAVLPWWRTAIPLIYVDNTLAAIGDLWINADVACSPGWRVCWEDAPRIVAPRAEFSIEGAGLFR